MDTLAKKRRGTERKECAQPKETDRRRRTWSRMRAEMMRRHVWRRVSASQRRAADLDLALELEAEPALDDLVEESDDHWLKASQTNTATAKTSQSANQTLLLSAVGSDEELRRPDEVNLDKK